MVFPVCSSVSTTTGLGKDCSIYIAYNKQIPLCQPPSTFGGRGGSLSSEKGECRDPLNLCTSDPAFDFDLSQGSSVRALLHKSSCCPQR
jgi:integrin alpha FG-GAP repeat containing protein 1